MYLIKRLSVFSQKIIRGGETLPVTRFAMFFQ